MTATDAIQTQLNRLRLHYAKSPLPKFFSWWRGELVGMLPKRWRGFFSVHAQELLLGTQAQGLQVWRRSGDTCAEYGRVGLDLPADEQRNEFAQLRDRIDDPGLRVCYCIAPQRSLRRELTLPAAAEDKLRQVLAFEMDRQTPFKADQVYFDYRILDRDAVAKNLRVETRVVPRAQLDPELATLAAGGVVLDGVDLWRAAPGTGRAGFNLLPIDRRAKRKNPRLRLNLALGAAAIILLITAAFSFLGNRQAALDAMTEEVSKAQNDAKQTSALMKRLRDNTDAANYLYRTKHDTPTTIELLSELTKRLPDDTFLERLTMDDKGKLDVQGQSSNAAKLIEVLQKSKVLFNPAFTGTIQKDPRSNKERFNLSIETRKPAEEAAPAKNAKPEEKSNQEKGGANAASA